MSTEAFERPARTPPASPQPVEVLLPAPPSPRPADGTGAWLTALPALAGLGSVAYLFAGPAGPVTYAAGSAFLLSSLAMALGSVQRGRGQARADATRALAVHERALSRCRDRVRELAADQRLRARTLGPDPDELWTVVTGPRLWERRAGDPDFGLLRVGVGTCPLAARLVPAAIAVEDEPDPVAVAAVERLQATHGAVPDVAVVLDVLGARTVSVHGPARDVRALCRALVVQAAALHGPDDLRIAILTPDPDDVAWAWAKWLPHAAHPSARDGAGPARLIARHADELGPALDAGGRRVLLVVDGVDPPRRDVGGTTVTVRRGAGDLALHLDTRGLWRDGSTQLGRPDAVSPGLAEALARLLARRRPAPSGTGRGGDTALATLLGVADPARPDVPALRSGARHLRTPLGVDAAGAPLHLDIAEAAQGGVGPHGLLVGATGSGKSELLRSLVLGMAATHGTDRLNLVLVDFKGGATFAGMAGLPHVAAVITNLADDLTLVDRMHAALSGELDRRQQVLRAAGNLVSLPDYDRARRRDPALPPLPSLWLVVDEFSELLAHRPEFIELFTRIGRLGRSLGIHLLLASQRVDDGMLRGLESHLSYRIGLRTFSEAESRAILGVPDAHHLPSAPGHGYLLADGPGLRRFRAAYSSAPHHPAVPPPTAAPRVVAFTVSASGGQPAPSRPDGPTVLDVMVAGLTGHGPPAHRVWLPPLAEPPTLGQLLPDLQVRPGRGFGTMRRAPLTAAVGVVDLPYLQRRRPHEIDLAGAAGHVAVVGAPRSGKSTLLRTVITALALRHTPVELQVYAVDLGGGSLFGLAGLPHVGAVAGRGDGELVRRLVADLADLVDTREQRFRELGVDGMAAYRAARAGGEVTDPFGDVLIVVDGWGSLRQDHDDVEEQLVALAARSLAYGVHLVLGATRWLDLRMGLRELVGTRLELKLGDALDSEVDRRAQESVPSGRPGRGLTPGRDHWLAAVPHVDGSSDADPAGALVRRVARHWDGPRAPAVRLLPTTVTAAELAPGPRGGVVLGVEGHRLSTVLFDPEHEQALTVLGDAGSGRTALLRAIARQVLQRHPPAAAKVVLIDPRRTLLGEFHGEGVLSYAGGETQVADAVAGLCEGFERRLPGADVTPEQLRARSWWSGPDVWVLIDDHDLLAAGGAALCPLARFLPHARDIGLRLVLARRAGGAARALADPVLGGMRELAQPAVVLSSPAEEGPLLGVRPGRRPPGRGVLVSARLGSLPVQLVHSPAASDGRRPQIHDGA